MDLIYTDLEHVELGFVPGNSQWDCVSSLGSEYKDNDFELTIPKAAWQSMPMPEGYLYEENTEWGGRIMGIENTGSEIKISGSTWRGMLANKTVIPPQGESHLVVTDIEANEFLRLMISTYFLTEDELFQVSSTDSKIKVSGQFRFKNLLAAIQETLLQSNARLDIQYSDGVVMLAAKPIADLSGQIELSDDYGLQITSERKNNEAYNHLICLGRGELLEREVIELYYHPNGEINTIPFDHKVIDDLQTVLDYPSAETTQELYDAGVEKLLEFQAGTENITINQIENLKLELGDIVSAEDSIIGLQTKAQISEVIRTVNESGSKYSYKVGR